MKVSEDLLHDVHCVLQHHSAWLSCTRPNVRREIVKSIQDGDGSGKEFWLVIRKYFPGLIADHKWVNMVGRELVKVITEHGHETIS